MIPLPSILNGSSLGAHNGVENKYIAARQKRRLSNLLMKPVIHFLKDLK
jgi:hypothetical protein